MVGEACADSFKPAALELWGSIERGSSYWLVGIPIVLFLFFLCFRFFGLFSSFVFCFFCVSCFLACFFLLLFLFLFRFLFLDCFVSFLVFFNLFCDFQSLLASACHKIRLCNLQSINFSGPERTKHIPRCWILDMTVFHVGARAKLHTFSLWPKTKGWVWFWVVGQVPCMSHANTRKLTTVVLGPPNMPSQKEATFFQPPSFRGYVRVIYFRVITT